MWSGTSKSGIVSLVLLFLLIIVSCGESNERHNVGNPVVVEFHATPSFSSRSGDPIELRWQVSGSGLSVTISNGIGQVEAIGSLVVYPTVSTAYSLNAHNQSGVATAALEVRVASVGLVPPVIAQFRAEPGAIESGDTSILSWVVDGVVDSVQIEPIAASGGATGSVIVAPSETTTYRLRAMNSAGFVDQEVTVQVNRPPVASFTYIQNQVRVPSEVAFDGTSSTGLDGDALQYHWSFGDGATSADINPVHSYGNAGTFVAELTVVDTHGASSSTAKTIQTRGFVTYRAGFQGCPGGRATVTYEWSGGARSQITVANGQSWTSLDREVDVGELVYLSGSVSCGHAGQGTVVLLVEVDDRTVYDAIATGSGGRAVVTFHYGAH